MKKRIIGLIAMGTIFIGCNKVPRVEGNMKEVSIDKSNQTMAVIPKEQMNKQCKTTVMNSMKLSNRVKYLTNTLIKCNNSNSSSICRPLRSELCQKKETLQSLGKKLKFDCRGSVVEREANILSSNFFEVSHNLKDCY